MTDRRALLLFAALAILTAFYPAFFGELPVPAGGALPLLPDPRSPRDRNDELADVPAQFLPWTSAVADAYRAGRLPLRFSANGCGTPLWANPQAQALTPTTLFSVVLGPAWGFGAAAAVKLWLAAAGTYLFARRRGLSRGASAWAGLAFGFALQITAWMHFPHTWPLALLPFALLALEGSPAGSAAASRRRRSSSPCFSSAAIRRASSSWRSAGSPSSRPSSFPGPRPPANASADSGSRRRRRSSVSA